MTSIRGTGYEYQRQFRIKNTIRVGVRCVNVLHLIFDVFVRLSSSARCIHRKLKIFISIILNINREQPALECAAVATTNLVFKYIIFDAGFHRTMESRTMAVRHLIHKTVCQTKVYTIDSDFLNSIELRCGDGCVNQTNRQISKQISTHTKKNFGHQSIHHHHHQQHQALPLRSHCLNTLCIRFDSIKDVWKIRFGVNIFTQWHTKHLACVVCERERSLQNNFSTLEL